MCCCHSAAVKIYHINSIYVYAYACTLLDDKSFLRLFFAIGGAGKSISDSEDESCIITNLGLHAWAGKETCISFTLS